MFAHHVIKSLEDPLNPLMCKIKMNARKNLSDLIKESTKYNLGNVVEDIYKTLQPVIIKHEKETGDKFRILRSKMEGVVSPFKIVWFEWFAKGKKVEIPKYASLILKRKSQSNKKGDQLSIYTFFFNNIMNKWGLSIIVPSIDLVTQNEETGWLISREVYDILTKDIIENFKRIDRYSKSCVHLGLLFLNCRNVKIIKLLPSPQLQKKRKKKGKLPIFSYHILKIKDMRRKTIKPDKHIPTPTGRKQRLHHMPARIVYYSKEKPLFGNPKNVGFYAFKDYWKGDPNEGLIISDYERRYNNV